MMGALPHIRLHLLQDALNADGDPTPCLLVPQGAGLRPVLVTFPTVSTALEEKRRLEGAG